MSTYAKDGVDIKAGDELSSYAARQMRKTWELNPHVRVIDHSEGNFRGPRTAEFVRWQGRQMTFPASDGIGTKPGIHVAANTPEHAAFDLLAMVTSDIYRYGGLACHAMNTLDIRTSGAPNSRERKFVERLYDGLLAAATEAGIAIVAGETAEVGTSVSWDDPESTVAFMWSAAATGLVLPERIINGSRLRTAQPIVALREHGFRCNGISSVRKALVAKFGTHWWRSSEAQEHLRDAAKPSILYDKLMRSALGWESGIPSLDITGIAHISGGGIRDKFGKDLVLRNGFSATLNNLFAPPPVMALCAQWRGVPVEERYGTWNGGQGMLVVMGDDQAAHQLIERAAVFGIEAQVCGRIGEHEKRPALTIKCAYPDDDRLLCYSP